MKRESETLLANLTTARRDRANALRPITRKQAGIAIRAAMAKMEAQRILGEHPFDFAKAIRGACAIKHNPIIGDWQESDAEYCRALDPGATPGSFLVPVAAADSILSQLAQYATGRASGARVWSMKGVQEMNIPAAVASPTFVWMAANSRQLPSDENLTGISFNLKLSQAFLLLPIQLFRTALPQWSDILSDSFAAGLAEAEDAAMHASATLVNAPLALMSQSGITIIHAAGGGASGGNLLYGDLLAALEKAVDLKVRPPLAWYMSGRSWLRVLSLNDNSSRPILSNILPEGSGPQVGHLLGWPVYVTSSIPVNEAVSSGTNQSHIILTNPKTINIGESGAITLEASTDFALESAQVAVRVGHLVDFGYQPAASIVALVGVN